MRGTIKVRGEPEAVAFGFPLNINVIQAVGTVAQEVALDETCKYSAVKNDK